MQGRIDDCARTPTAYEPEPRYKNKLPYALARLLRQCSCVVGPEVEQGALLDLVTCFVVTHCEDSRLQAVIAKAGELWHRRNAGYRTDDNRFSVLVTPSDGADNEAAFDLATRLSVADAVAERLRDEAETLRAKIIDQKEGPARLMGKGCVRFSSTGELWVLNRHEGGFGSFGFRCGSWDEVFRRWDVRVTEHGTDEHGEFWTVESMRK